MCFIKILRLSPVDKIHRSWCSHVPLLVAVTSILGARVLHFFIFIHKMLKLKILTEKKTWKKKWFKSVKCFFLLESFEILRWWASHHSSEITCSQIDGRTLPVWENKRVQSLMNSMGGGKEEIICEKKNHLYDRGRGITDILVLCSVFGLFHFQRKCVLR